MRLFLLCFCLLIALSFVSQRQSASAAEESGGAADPQTLLTEADGSRVEFEEGRQALDDALKRLAELRRGVFRAEQNQLLATQEIGKTAEQLKGTWVKLAVAAGKLATARSTLQANRQASIDASRRVKESLQQLKMARQYARRSAEAVTKLSATARSLTESASVLKRASELIDAAASAQAEELHAALDAIDRVQMRADVIVEQATRDVTAAVTEYQAALVKLREEDTLRRNDEQEHSTASRAHFAIQRQISRLQTTENRLRQQGKESGRQVAEARQSVAAEEKRVAELEAEVAQRREQWVADQERAELALEHTGKFLSFSRVVAPVFARRCASCHNNRSAGGRLNMNSYAALLKGGESGASVIPGDAENSLLVMMIEDDSMPKDADPLTVDEITIIKKWIDLGAPLDARASETAPLFDIMPEFPQPKSPESYRVSVPVLAVAVSPDGSLLATSGYHEVLLWTIDGTLIRRIGNVAQRIHDIEFTHDGQTIAVAAGTPGQYGELKLFSVSDGNHLATLARATDSFYALSISPDGKLLATGGADGVVRIVNLERSELVLTLQEHSGAVLDVSWAADSRRIVTAGQDKVSKVFDVETGESLQTFAEHEDAVFTAAFLPNGEEVVSGGADGKMRVWQIKTRGSESLTELAQNQKQMKQIGGFATPVARMIVTEFGVVTMTSGGAVHIHDTSDWKRQRTFAGHDVSGFGLAWDANSKRIVSGGYDGEVRFWNPNDGAMTHSFVAIPREATVVLER